MSACYYSRTSARPASTAEAWNFPPPRGEARALLSLLGKNGNTTESLLGLIRVTPTEGVLLRAAARSAPEMVDRIEKALAYRLRVEQEFEKLRNSPGA